MSPELDAPAGAPAAPGRMGVPVDPQAAFVYLEALGRWRDHRQRELEQLDQAALSALSAANGQAAIADITLSMALWKAVADRYELLVRTWDSGRVGPAERERMSSLIWGRMDATLDPGLVGRSTVPGNSAVAVSLPEACRLSDALANQLRVRLGLEASGQETTARIRTLRSQMERIRDQVGLEPAGSAQQEAAAVAARLGRRLKEITDKAGRGGDVGGLIAPLEIEAATFERDLIVDGARRREAAGLVRTARQRRSELEAREAELNALVDRCVATVTPAPHYAVPDIEALGPVPNTPDRLTAYLRRLDQVARAMTVVQHAYGAALAEHEELVGRLDAYRVKAAATGLAQRPDVTQAHTLASTALGDRPCRMAIARQLVTLYQTYVQLESP